MTLDTVECTGCGRSFQTTDGEGMIAALKGPCPSCGAPFALHGEHARIPEDRAEPGEEVAA